jgi:DNA-binding MarR family transcriptional regulator
MKLLELASMSTARGDGSAAGTDRAVLSSSKTWARRTRNVFFDRYIDDTMHGDYLDTILAQWTAERPDLDVSPMGVIGRISRLSRVLESNIDQVFASYNLTRGGFDVLAALRRSGSPFRLSPTELYNSLLISSGAMTNRVDRLEERKLVVRVPDPSDRRGVLVALTSKGRRLVDSVIETHLENEQRLLGHLNTLERQDLAQLLKKLLVNLEGSRESPAKDEVRRARPVA